MSTPLILISSVTYALKGKRVLSSYGIKAEIQKFKLPGRSCSYKLAVVQNKTAEAIEILKSNGIKLLDRTERNEDADIS